MATESIKIRDEITPIRLGQAATICIDMLHAEMHNDFRERLTPLFLGPPGQGKTAIVQQVVHMLNAKRDAEIDRMINNLDENLRISLEEAENIVGPKWTLVSYRLAQCDPTDLRGVPVYHSVNGHEMAASAPPRIFPIKGIPDSADGNNVIFFLDELPQALPTIQNLAANIIDGKIGDYEIDPSRCFIVCAGNRKEDKAATFEIPNNVNNRLARFTVRTEFPEWEEWAMANKVNALMIGYLKEHSVLFNEKPSENQKSYGTPRSWTKVSAYMNYIGSDFFNDTPGSTHSYVVQGLVGHSAAADFMRFARNLRSKYSIHDIIDGKKVPVPKATERDALFSIVLEAASTINNWVEEVLSPSILSISNPEEKTNKIIDALGKMRVEGICNLYTWLDQPGIDPSFQVLINKYQTRKTADNIRYAFMTHEKFAKIQPIYMAISNKLSATLKR